MKGLLLLAAFILWEVFSFAQVPKTITYQGIISDNGTTPVQDGKYNITFLLFESETGGQAVWEETQETDVESGIFNTVLGKANPLVIPFDKAYWLGMKINESNELTPRTQLSATPYSFNTISISDSIVTSRKIADGQLVRSINSLKDDVKLVAGNNIDLAFQNNSIEISSKGGGSLSLPFSGEVETSGGALNIINKGSGHAAFFNNSNPDRVNAVLQVMGKGKGNLLNVLSQDKGSAAFFEIGDAENEKTVITGNNNGIGVTAEFINFNQANESSVLSVSQRGLGEVILVENINKDNTLPALDISTSGTGLGLRIRHSGGSGNIAEFLASGQNQLTIDRNGNLNAKGSITIGSKIIFPDGSEQTSASSGSGQFWNLRGNINTNTDSAFIGTIDKKTFQIKVNNTRAFRIEPVSVEDMGVIPNIIGGSAFNTTFVGVKGATISGGGGVFMKGNIVSGDFGFVGGGAANNAGTNAAVSGGYINSAQGDFSSISGGESNYAHGNHSTVAGGKSNTAADFYSTVSGGRENLAQSVETGAATVSGGEFNQALNDAATVGGGENNISSGAQSTIGGGSNNTASGQHSSIAGGTRNIASGNQSSIGGGEENAAIGESATVPGGDGNQARGDYSFAAGFKAKAAHDGSFVWNDRSVLNGNDSLVSTAENQFLIRAKGGVDFKTNTFTINNSNNNALFIVDVNGNATLAGTLVEQSDRNAKMNFLPVDTKKILTKISGLPISTWSYKDDPNVKHIGPMAQDFKAVFGVGADETTISVIDRDGVALAAIQALWQMLIEKESVIQDLINRILRLEKQIQ